MREGKRHYEWVVQDKYEDGPWTDHGMWTSLPEARKGLATRRGKWEWTADGKRQWRMVRRCITETILGE